jgi:8-hydroxy-5-deazaflavin:NADPH oxidoreductase
MSNSASSEAVGIIGSGRLGQALARTILRAGRPAVLSNSRGPESLTSVVSDLGPDASAGTAADAAGCAMVALAVPWTSVRDAVDGLTWAGKIVIDATNALLFPDFRPAPLEGRTSSEIVAELVDGAMLIKAANTLGADVLGADPNEAGGRRVLFVSGDHETAKGAVIELFDAAGFFVVDLGGLVAGGAMQQFEGPLAGHNLVRFSAGTP